MYKFIPMAKIKPSAIISGISGKINGTVFLNTQFGIVAKKNSYSLPQNSPKQKTQQSKIQFVSSRWNQLTQIEKDTWQSEVLNYPQTDTFGNTFYFTAYQLFLYLNNNLYTANESVKVSAPTYTPLVIPTITIQLIDSFDLVFDIVGAGANSTLFLYGTRGLPPDRNAKASDYLLFDTSTIPNGSFPIGRIASYNSNIGQIVSGLRYWFMFKIMVTNNGHSSNKLVLGNQIAL